MNTSKTVYPFEWEIPLVFLLFGPPIGCLLMFVIPSLSTLEWSGILLALIFSYLFGGIQAFTAGCIIAWIRRKNRSHSLWLYILIGALCGGIPFMFMYTDIEASIIISSLPGASATAVLSPFLFLKSNRHSTQQDGQQL